MPRVTVLSAIYKDAAFVRQAIESVLAQTFTDFELLIMNDASVDDSRTIAASYNDPRIRIVDNDHNLGLTKSLNRGLALARGELIARFDGNDVCFPQRLAKQVEFLDEHPDVAVVGVQSTIIDTAGNRIRRAETHRPTTQAGIRWCSIFDTPLIHSGVMYRRSVVWDDLGGYDETFTVGQDNELWLRVGRKYRLANLDEKLMAVRSDPRSISADVSLPIRRGHTARFESLIHANMQQNLAWPDVPRDWAAAWVEWNDPSATPEPSRIRLLTDALDECRKRFATIEPSSRNDHEVNSHHAFMLSRGLWQIATRDRLLALAMWRRVLSLDPATALRSMPKLTALITLGELPLRLVRARRSGRM